MSDEIKRLLDEGVELGRRTQSAIDAVRGAHRTVPASEHQRLQAERDALQAEAAAMREALEHVRVVLDTRSGTYPFDRRELTVACEAALSSSAGSARLEEVEGLRAKLADEQRLVATLRDQIDGMAREWNAESADLRARLEAAERERDNRYLRSFPIQGGPAIPWALIEAHEKQAILNHNQSLACLAGRGGLSPREAVAVLDGLSWREVRDTMREDEAKERLAVLVSAWESAQRASEVRRAVEEEREVLLSGIASTRAAIRAGADPLGRLDALATAIRSRGGM